ncbi:MAG: ABC transporter permease [Nocardioidaceae bacterium]|nr:ABC transporter permease [Nocardioidaceae bacterium]
MAIVDTASGFRITLTSRFRAGNKTAIAAMGVLVLLLLLGLVVPLVAGSSNVAQQYPSLLSPSLRHPFGTDHYGRDVFLRCMAGARVDILLGLAVAASALVLGSLIGSVSATFGGATDAVIMRLTDVFLAFPGVVLALVIAASLGKDPWYAAIAVVIAFIPLLVRLTRSKALEVRAADYIAAARLSGARPRQIAFQHVLPNSFKYPFVQSTLVASWAILDFAALSFLGVGVQPPHAEWGAMIADGVGDNLLGAWWPSFFPGLMILLTAAAFQVIGDWLDRRLQ